MLFHVSKQRQDRLKGSTSAVSFEPNKAVGRRCAIKTKQGQERDKVHKVLYSSDFEVAQPSREHNSDSELHWGHLLHATSKASI